MALRITTLFLILAALVPAQENRATVLGHVTDPSGAVVSGGRVLIKNLDTGVEVTSATNDQGNYLVPALPAGRYTITVEQEGFKRAQASEVTLRIQQIARLDFRLELGAVADMLSVTAQTPLLVTDDVTLGQGLDSKKIVELPILGRNMSSLTLLGVGTAASSNGIARILGGILTGGVTMTANGIRTSANQYSIDGANVNVGFYNFPSYVPVVDAVAEFKVRTGSFSAEYGGYGGAHVDYSLRSGTNEHHVTLWEFLRNDKADARNAFALTKPVLRQNQFGALAAGPIVKNKTFYMASWQALRRRNQAIPQTTVPTEAMRNGDLTRRVDGQAEAAIVDPATGAPFPGNQIPRSRISGPSLRYLEFYPRPNQAGPINYRTLSGIPRDEDSLLAKIDHVFSESNRLSGRYVYQQTDNPNAIAVIRDFGTRIPTRSQNIALNDTHTFSPTTLLDVRLSWNRQLLKELGPRGETNYDVERELGVRVPTSARPGTLENGIPQVAITGFATMGDSLVVPLVQPDENYQIVAALSKLKGKHNLKAGIDFRRARSARFQGNFINGSISFEPGNAGGSGHAFADFLLGLPRQSQVATVPVVVDFRQTRNQIYIADTWTATPKLTLTLGLRYELNSSPHETYGRISFFNFDAPGSFRRFSNGEPLFITDKNNFGPRLGIAYRPFGKTVFRSAYGVFFSEPKLLGMNLFSVNPPLITNQNFFSSREAPLAFTNPFPLGLAAAGGVPSINSYQRDRRTPYVQTWQFNVQHMLPGDFLVDAGYVGNLALKMGRRVDLNVPVVPAAGPIQARRPLPNFGPARHFMHDSNSSYQSLQVRVERQFAKGFSILSSYTFSRNIDISGDEQVGNTIDPRNLNRDRSLSESHAKNRLTLSYVWELPFGPGKPWLTRGGLAGGITGGWQLSGVTNFQSGGALTAAVAGDRANLGLGTRPNRVCDGNLSSGRTIARWFDTSCFAAPPALTIGNSGRNILIGPGDKTWNLGIGKKFAITEKHWLQFRAEMFNAFNHVNLGNPGTTVDTPAYGRITGANDARGMQFGLKYGF